MEIVYIVILNDLFNNKLSIQKKKFLIMFDIVKIPIIMSCGINNEI